MVLQGQPWVSNPCPGEGIRLDLQETQHQNSLVLDGAGWYQLLWRCWLARARSPHTFGPLVPSDLASQGPEIRVETDWVSVRRQSGGQAAHQSQERQVTLSGPGLRFSGRGNCQVGVSPPTSSHRGGWRFWKLIGWVQLNYKQMLRGAPAPECHCQDFLRLP